MEIQSALNAGLQGFSNAQQTANEAAAAIASGVVSESVTSQNTSENTQNSTDQATNQNQPVNLNQEVVNLKVAEYQARASAEVIDSADEALGTLLDVRV